tara:strand:+ start:4692 stop:4835 length:144 start_codon:yes stop_codon:yes gene_type:complete
MHSDNKKKDFCKHGYHIGILCLQCQQERKNRAAALKRVQEAAKKLTW